MSESPNPSENVSETEPSDAGSKPAGKKNTMKMIAAIAVVLILIGAAAVVLTLPKDKTPTKVDLKATISPDPFVVPAGSSQQISVKVMDGTQDISATTGVKFQWSADMVVGELLFKAKQKVNLSAVKWGANGTITCAVTYKGVTATDTASVTVSPPFLESIEMNPPTLNLGHFKSQNVSATAVSSVGAVLPVTNFTWSVTGMSEPNCTLWGQYRPWVYFNTTDYDRDGVTLSATGKYGGVEKTGTTTINISNIILPRSVVYRWYDMFNVPFGQWWYERMDGEVPYTSSYPYILKYDLGSGNIWYYMNPRLNVTARNITEINTNTQGANPFLPHWGIASGGNIVIDWYLSYLTKAQVDGRYPGSYIASLYDGWYAYLNGTILMDKQAAMGVLGISSADFTNFDTWWAGSNGKSTIQSRWQSWLNSESSDQHYWIMPAYSTDMMQMDISMDAVKVGDKIQLSLYDLSWGMETLLTRWLRATFMPTEWYFEDFKMHMEIGPEVSNVDIDTIIVYGMFALETNNIPPGQTHGQPTWIWQAMEQDYLAPTHTEVPTAEHRINEFEVYSVKKYLNRHVGSEWYGQMSYYDYTPGAFNLKANETMTFEWPTGNVKFLLGTGVGTFAVVQDKINVSWAEPSAKDQANITAGGIINADLANNKLTYTGPIDFSEWSRTQTSDTYLMSEWARLGGNLMPYGCPWIEFRSNELPPPMAMSIKVEGLDSPIVSGDSSSAVKVSIYDQYGQPYPGYDGTVNFTTSGPATGLPANYTFVPATDHGVHNFTGIALTGTGDYWVNVTDTVKPTINGSLEVLVVPQPERVVDFVISGVPANINVGDPVGATVTAYDQYGYVYWRYVGTVNLTTNATPGTYNLAANYTFTPADKGVHRFSPAVTFNGVGTFNLVVADTANLSANGTKQGIEVKVSPEMTYTVYDMFEQHWREWWWQRASYEIDLVISNTPHNYSMIYTRDLNGLTGYAYAPYRYNTTAKNMTTLNVEAPEYMPVLGPLGTPNARSNLTIHWDYINNTWFNNSWYPKWRDNSDWTPAYNASIRDAMPKDGYIVATDITVVMNREAAVSWLNLSLTESDVGAWWAAKKAWYGSNWTDWVKNEGNFRLDIYAGYADIYYSLGTMTNLIVLANGDLQLEIGHFSWGYEVLMMRWNTEAKISTHETYMEDYTMVAQYTVAKTDVTFDGVCQWSLKAVVANGTVNGSAWAWEPMKIDYVTASGHHSDFAPYEPLTYTDWNALDPNYGTPLGPTGYPAFYENTPAYFNLTSYQKLVFILPKGNQVLGYKGEATWVDTATYTQSSITNGTLGDLSDFDRLTVHGEMTLGYYKSGGVDIGSMYNPVDKTIVIQGPQNFDNFHHWPGGPLYHGAPWIEFNVTYSGTPGPAHTDSLPSTEVGGAAAQSSSASTAMLAVVAVSIASLCAFAVVLRRRLEE